jgi:hypothetical protein
MIGPSKGGSCEDSDCEDQACAARRAHSRDDRANGGAKLDKAESDDEEEDEEDEGEEDDDDDGPSRSDLVLPASTSHTTRLGVSYASRRAYPLECLSHGFAATTQYLKTHCATEVAAVDQAVRGLLLCGRRQQLQ